MRGGWWPVGSEPIIKSSPIWTRTKNLPVNSRLLCQLSYGGPFRARLELPEATGQEYMTLPQPGTGVIRRAEAGSGASRPA